MFETGLFSALKAFLHERRLLFFVIVFLLLGTIYGSYLHYLGFGYQQLLFDALTSSLLFIVYASVLSRIHRYYHSKSSLTAAHLAILLVFTGLYLLICDQYADLFFPQQPAYLEFMRSGLVFRGIIAFLILLAVVNQFWIDKHISELEKRKQLQLEHEKKLIQAELVNLKQHFQPHFLFNSLNSISALMISQPQEARRMVLLLSDFLRLSIRKKDQDFVVLSAELEYLELYLEIEKVRFGHRLQVNYELEPGLGDLEIPAQVLQPVLENAIKYGLYGNTGELSIGFQLRLEHELLLVRISNPCDEQAVSTMEGAGFGLKSIDQKLNILFGRSDLMHIDRKDTAFTLELRFPVNKPKTN